MTMPAIADRIPITDHVRTFRLTDGRSLAVDRRVVAFVREETGHRSSLALKLSGQRPLVVECPFSEAIAWWLTSPVPREERHADG
jgi:hypothetical protein